MRVNVKLEGDKNAFIALRGVRGEKEAVRRLLDDTAREALTSMRMNVPVSSGKLFSSVQMTEVKWHPGGAGGGGFHEVHVGPGVGTLPAPEHLDYVFGGTSDVFNKRMRIHKKGEEPHWINRRRGQEPQQDWVITAQRVATQRIAAGIRTLDLFR